MKALSFAVVLIALSSNQNTLAQSPISYRFGVTGGLNGNLIHVTSFTNPNSRSTALWHYNAGVSVEQRLTRTFTFAYDLLYSHQGGVESIHGPVGSDQIITKLDYLSLPVLLRYYPGGQRVFVGVGPQVGWLLAVKSYFASDEGDGFGNLRSQRRVDAGLTAVLGYRMGKHLIMATRYYYGINPINAPDSQTGIYYQGFKEYNRTWSSNLIYYF